MLFFLFLLREQKIEEALLHQYVDILRMVDLKLHMLCLFLSF